MMIYSISILLKKEKIDLLKDFYCETMCRKCFSAGSLTAKKWVNGEWKKIFLLEKKNLKQSCEYAMSLFYTDGM